ncbi:PhzF family phenazine biosynthesis protein [soil metagenome]
MPTVHVLRVFTGSHGSGGNPLGVFPDGPRVVPESRQAVAADLGFSETAFVDDAASGTVAVFTPAVELPFAGHPLVGASWLLRRLGWAPAVLRPPAGIVATWVDGDGRTWIRARPEWAPDMTLRRFPGPDDVDALTAPPEGLGFVLAWAWLDEAAGAVRARVFAPAAGIPEDEATGAAALRLVSCLGRAVTVRQGRGSLLLARPGPAGTAEVGGAVESYGSRSYAAPAAS